MPHEFSKAGITQAGSPEPSRIETRHPVVRMVDYTRVEDAIAPAARTPFRVGFTRDLSDSGMCLGLDEAASVGSLLRVTVHDLDGAPQEEAVARVVWSCPDTDSRIWHGLALIPKTVHS